MSVDTRTIARGWLTDQAPKREQKWRQTGEFCRIYAYFEAIRDVVGSQTQWEGNNHGSIFILYETLFKCGVRV